MNSFTCPGEFIQLVALCRWLASTSVSILYLADVTHSVKSEIAPQSKAEPSKPKRSQAIFFICFLLVCAGCKLSNSQSFLMLFFSFSEKNFFSSLCFLAFFFVGLFPSLFYARVA